MQKPKKIMTHLFPLVLYVENAPALAGPRFVNDGITHPSIERGLVRYSEEHPFDLSQIINCETRIINGAASRVLSCHNVDYLCAA